MPEWAFKPGSAGPGSPGPSNRIFRHLNVISRVQRSLGGCIGAMVRDVPKGGMMKHAAQKSIGFRLMHVSRLYRARMAMLLNDLGLFPGQERALLFLADHDGATIGELSRALLVRPPTISKTINRLATEGLVERMSSVVDSRIVHVTLTETGRSKLAELERLTTVLEDEILDILDDKEARRLRKSLRRLARGLQGHLDPQAELGEEDPIDDTDADR